MTETWTLSELVAEAAARLAALPPPKNGQVRAVPDERTIRYYGTIGLLDRPAAMRGRTALYGRRHLAQVVAIKRMQSAGHSLADIQRMWPTLDDVTLGRMSGVQVVAGKARAARKEFWKREAEPSSRPQVQPHAQPPSHAPAHPQPRSHPQPQPQPMPPPIPYPRPLPAPGWPDRTGPSSGSPVVLPVPTFTPYPATAPGAAPSAAPTITIPLAAGASIVIALPEDRPLSLSPADLRALRVAAAPLVTELAKRGLVAPANVTLEEP